MTNFKLRVADDFEASSANPRRLRNLARPNPQDHERLILLAVAGVLIGALLIGVLRWIL